MVWCECGCGEQTPIATATRRGYRAGDAMRFVHGHNRRKPRETVTDARCGTCKRTLPAGEFYADPRKWNGLSGRCMACAKATSLERHRKQRAIILEYQAEYRARPGRRERQRVLAVQWERSNPLYAQQLKRDREAARRARKRNQFDEHVDSQVVYERDNGTCRICGDPVLPYYFDLDHIIPLVRGGRHSYTNIQLAHPSCNARKGGRLPKR